LGGGIRDLDTIERYIDDGVGFVVIGTAAVKNPGFLHDACSAFAGHVIVALDAKGGKVATDGWSKLTGHDVNDLAKKFETTASRRSFTRHRARRHVDRREHRGTVELARHVKIPVIASGGVAQMADIEALCAVESDGIMGAILGRSLYEGTVDFKARRSGPTRWRAEPPGPTADMLQNGALHASQTHHPVPGRDRRSRRQGRQLRLAARCRDPVEIARAMTAKGR